MTTNFDIEELLDQAIKNVSDKIGEINSKIEESSRKAVSYRIFEQAVADAKLGSEMTYKEERVNLEIELQRLAGERIEVRQIHEALLTFQAKIQTPENKKGLEGYFKTMEDILAG